MKKIIDEFSDLPISNQLKHLKRKKRDGVCAKCSSPVAIGSTTFCETHRQSDRITRTKLRAEFAPIKKSAMLNFIGPMKPKRQSSTEGFNEVDAKRFWAKVEIKSKNECWEWTGYLDRNGYGQLHRRGITHTASRVAYFINNPSGFDNDLCVCHHCDNPSCCNPEHLFQGTNKDNSVDMVAKNRSRSALKCEQVVEMRLEYKSEDNTLGHSHWAEKFGVHKTVIGDAIRGTTFSELK